ncbi:MAG: hypothetical protein Q4F67_16330 [Propionibacteriaceae bacterium]|nr:hypothetical protein [Propionibacteriaceae bacterium]
MSLFAVAPDPSSVVAGWIPLALTVALGVIMVFLYRSLRKQMRRINIPEGGVPTRGDRADRTASPETPEVAGVDEPTKG